MLFFGVCFFLYFITLPVSNGLSLVIFTCFSIHQWDVFPKEEVYHDVRKG